jgi:hypothetical protein
MQASKGSLLGSQGAFQHLLSLSIYGLDSAFNRFGASKEYLPLRVISNS